MGTTPGKLTTPRSSAPPPSSAKALARPRAAELEPSQWEKQTDLVKKLLGKVLKDQFTAPDFFTVGPLKLATHPAYAATPFAGAAPPSGLTFEHREGLGEGQGGAGLKLGFTFNLPQIAGLLQEDAPKASYLADLTKNRGPQASTWFTFERLDPTALQLEAGKLPAQTFKAGTLFGSGGFLGQLEAGARYGGEEAKELTSWFVRGGFGYSGKQGAVIRKLGFDAIYTDWKELDVLAPRVGPAGTPAAGSAFRLTPFFGLEAGKRHKFSAGAALGFVTGTHESFDVSDFRADLAYTYMGDRSKDQLPVFKLDVSGSLSRLDFFDPLSPLMSGLRVRASVDKYFVAGQVQTGAGAIPEQRAAQIGEAEKVRVPTAVLFTAGVHFGGEDERK